MMPKRKNIHKRLEQLEKAERSRYEHQKREPLPPPVWFGTNEPERRYKRSELKPGELPPPIWLVDDD